MPSRRAAWTICALAGAAAAALTACYGDSTARVVTDQPPPAEHRIGPVTCTRAPPPPTPTRLLTRAEYDNTVRALLGDTTRPAQAFPAEPKIAGFENNPLAYKVNPLLVSSYLEAAEALSARALREHRALILPCDPAAIGEAACGEAFLQSFVPRAFRRPPTDEELAGLRAFFQATLQSDGFDAAVEWTLQVILQSPQFLYRVEEGVPDGPEENALTSWELASRLSYLLWASMPDEELLTAARAGQLSTPEGIAAQARRMIADPRSRDSVHNFFRQWLTLERMDQVDKDRTSFPQFTPKVASAWRGGVERFLDQTFWSGEPTLKTLLTSSDVYVSDVDAPLYGMAMIGEGFQRFDLGQRYGAGLLTQPGLLAELAGPLDSSPVKRGVFIRQKLLCENLAPPPANVSILPPDPDPSATTRERFAEHESNPTCAGCHVKIDPVGFGFEQYDALGRFRTEENGKPVDVSGAVNGTDDPALAGPFHGAVELAQKLAASAQVQDCVATQWFRYAMGRLEVEGDECSLKRVKDRFRDSRGDFRELLVAITQTPAFRTRAAPEVTP